MASEEEHRWAVKIKEKYKRDLLRVGGVVGVGVGIDNGKYVIVVNVSGEFNICSIPFGIEGIPVQIENVGWVKAL